MEPILDVLMERDGLTKEEAEELIREAKEDFHERLESGDLDGLEDICQEWFGLEPDYIEELFL